MSFSPCFLIPIYNHWRTIRSLVEHLAGYGLRVFIVDDGSNVETQNELAALARDFPFLRLHRLPENAGKGAAVMHGMREALSAGFSHALQIDADGQHDTGDVPRFLELGAAYPDAMICGQPVYDASVPKGRLYGRYVTHFWVGVETLSLSIPDSMCGFRLYPLAASCALINKVSIPTRMEFDIEVMVRLAWAGVEFKTLDTRVIYPDDGISHFKLLRDNLCISKMHTRLCFGMLLRLPILLSRKLFGQRRSIEHWSRLGERGSVLGLKTVFACYNVLGERVARWLLYPIVGYFFISGCTARVASLDFLRRVHRANGLPEPTWRDSFRHMLAFGQAGLDKLAAWAGGVSSRQVDFPDRPELLRLINSGRGAVLIGAHLGNLEMIRALAVNERQAAVNAVVYTEHAQRFNDLLKQANADFGVNLIPVSQLGPETAILLKEKVDKGELVVIVGDRTPPTLGSRVRISHAQFFGEPAPFAQGPFILSSLLDCPVYLCFCLREKRGTGHGYRIYLETFAERVMLPRRERQARLDLYIQHYAERLEHYCRQAPEQWFNFYDFWQATATTTSNKA